jgi:ABC-type branched-subunit amino acid transport system ATPase component
MVRGGARRARGEHQCVPGQIVGLIGPNGAGKSTVLNCMSGIDRPDAGTVRLGGKEITRWPIDKRARAGVGRTFQLLRLFESLTIAENIALGVEGTWWTRLAGGPRYPRGRLSRRQVADRVGQALSEVGMERFGANRVDTLTAGQKRLVEIARSLAQNAAVLLLDEPAAGLNPTEAEELFALIEGLAAQGKAVLLVEHRIRSVLRIAHTLSVMDHGTLIAQGGPDEVMNMPTVQEAYMGKSDAVR